jgi:hypothetical protein
VTTELILETFTYVGRRYSTVGKNYNIIDIEPSSSFVHSLLFKSACEYSLSVSNFQMAQITIKISVSIQGSRSRLYRSFRTVRQGHP